MSGSGLEIVPIKALVVPEFTTVEPGSGTRSDFARWLDVQTNEIDASLDRADHALQQLALGETSNIHHVMIALEEARLSFELALQVRNKVLEAYQEVMRMQV